MSVRRSENVSNSSMTPTRVFGTPGESSSSPGDASTTPDQGASGRRSFFKDRPSFSRWRRSSSNVGGGADEENGVLRAGAGTPSDRPPIPSALQQPEEYSTPLPTLSMVVLSIAMLAEFLSANVSAPFLLFMVKGFGGFNDDADAGFWTGILGATFFLTQFLTSLLWATVASKHGVRLVLFVSLLGTAVTCCIFGTSKSLEEAICIRLLQGIFAGAIGVARGSVTAITDPSNEGRAYAILGFCWGFGGVAGAIVGGTFESPAIKWPDVFGKSPLLVKYPYLLPCAVASTITLTGAVLSLFLGYDGGPREGAIQLPIEKNPGHETIPEADEEGSRAGTPPPIFDEEEERPKGLVSSISKNVGRKLSGYFSKGGSQGPDASHASGLSGDPSISAPVPLSSSAPKFRTFSTTHPSRADGSAYGYSEPFRNRLASNATVYARRGSMASTVRRRLNRTTMYDPTSSSYRDSTDGSELNFAQRLLMANENAVTNIADLWVAAAMNVDNEEVFESDSELDDEEERRGEEGVFEDDMDVPGSPPTPTHAAGGRRQSASGSTVRPHRASHSTNRFSNVPRRPSYSQHRSSGTVSDRRGSNFIGGVDDRRASIFSHTGVRAPPVPEPMPELQAQTEGDSLAPIMESRRASVALPAEGTEKKEPSLIWQLPLIIIVQYGLLALHSTTHDTVFYLYLVTDYEGGGLNLNAGHFSQLIAFMCLCQIAYQFYLYPNMGPPRGRFSHLAMFRLGSLLFIPAYLSVVLYRIPFASPKDDGNFALMSALTLSTALRFCGNTFAYTAVAVLLNYMTPPHLVGLANGIAQSIVSLARFFGPILGGVLWSESVAKDPSGYPFGFFGCAAICAVAVLHSCFIR